MINTTRLLRRIEKYVREGGYESHLGKGIGHGFNFVNHLRGGRQLRDATLEKADVWLTERGY